MLYINPLARYLKKKRKTQRLGGHEFIIDLMPFHVCSGTVTKTFQGKYKKTLC